MIYWLLFIIFNDSLQILIKAQEVSKIMSYVCIEHIYKYHHEEIKEVCLHFPVNLE